MAERLTALRYPFAVDAGGGRLTEEGDLDAYIRGLIRQVLLTAPGERINRPDFGAGVRRMVFAANDATVASLAETYVLDALTRWLSTLIGVDEVKARSEQEKLLITVRYRVLRRGETRVLNEEVTF
ncbi:GPW/gp25 family protein [Thioalkalicoccus limnaeus]|uniref:GPW/gp25 family protein n=1 Tax=Thioalkalicoccus limnaeus TaxID=120681 RepID=A0ABV4BHV9_9GAMM